MVASYNRVKSLSFLIRSVFELKRKVDKINTRSLKIHSIIEPDLSSKNCSIFKLNVCVQNYGNTKLADLSVQLPTGFSAINVLYPEDVLQYEDLTNTEKLKFFINNLKKNKVCTDLILNRTIIVDNIQNSHLVLMDYHQPNLITVTKYKPSFKSCSKAPISKPKRESLQSLGLPSSNESEELENNGFVDIGQDLDVPEFVEDMEPVYILPPANFTPSGGCPLCFKEVPRNYKDFYCSSQSVVKMRIRDSGYVDFILDISKDKEFSRLKNNVFITKKAECKCSSLETVGNEATGLLIIQPPRAIDSKALHILHLDFNIQVILLSGKENMAALTPECPTPSS